MFEPMAKYLESQGHEILEQDKNRERGIDIVMIKDGSRILVELKETSTEKGVDFGILLLFVYLIKIFQIIHVRIERI